MSFQTSVPTSLNILSQYFLALSERNLDGMASLMHYPFMTHEGPEAMLVESKDQLMSAPPLSMNVTGKGDSKIKPGAYDILDYMQMHIYSPVGAGLTLEYSSRFLNLTATNSIRATGYMASRTTTANGASSGRPRSSSQPTR